MPIDPRELRGRNARPSFGEVIDSDRPCGKCGYNLKGLASGGRCPECGYPITRRGRKGAARFSDNLVDAPLFYLKTLAIGTSLLAGGVGLIVLMVVWEWLAIFRFVSVPASWPMVVAGFFAVASMAWWVGVFICTAQRPMSERTLPDKLLESVVLRWINRGVQAAWVLSAVAFFAELRMPAPASDIAGWASLAFAILALVGLIPLSLQLSSLADWAGDTELSGWFRLAASVIAICGGMAVLSWIATKADLQGFWYAVRILGFWARSGLALAEIVLVWSLYRLAHITAWAIKNSLTAHEVSLRLAERAGDAMAHRTCPACGYDMKGLSAFDRCPECGHLEESVRQSGLLALSLNREAAQAAAAEATSEEIPLEPQRGDTARMKIQSPPPIKAGRRHHPPQT